MNSAIELFRESVIRVRGVGGIAQALTAMTTTAIDTSDLLRAQIVLAVSALDHYVHEITRLGMLEIFDGKRVPSTAYRRFRISLDSVESDYKIERYNVDAEIRQQHSYLAFQQPDKVADAIRLFSDVKLWEAVGVRLSLDAGLAKQQLRLCIDRRNKIAHEADLDPTYPKARWPISPTDVESVVKFLVELVEAIHVEVS